MQQIDTANQQHIIKNLQTLSQMQLVSVAAFIEKLQNQEAQDHCQLSQPALTKIWDNDEDAVYDQY